MVSETTTPDIAVKYPMNKPARKTGGEQSPVQKPAAKRVADPVKSGTQVPLRHSKKKLPKPETSALIGYVPQLLGKEQDKLRSQKSTRTEAEPSEKEEERGPTSTTGSAVKKDERVNADSGSQQQQQQGSNQQQGNNQEGAQNKDAQKQGQPGPKESTPASNPSPTPNPVSSQQPSTPAIQTDPSANKPPAKGQVQYFPLGLEYTVGQVQSTTSQDTSSGQPQDGNAKKEEAKVIEEPYNPYSNALGGEQSKALKALVDDAKAKTAIATKQYYANQAKALGLKPDTPVEEVKAVMAQLAKASESKPGPKPPGKDGQVPQAKSDSDKKPGQLTPKEEQLDKQFANMLDSKSHLDMVKALYNTPEAQYNYLRELSKQGMEKLSRNEVETALALMKEPAFQARFKDFDKKTHHGPGAKEIFVDVSKLHDPANYVAKGFAPKSKEQISRILEGGSLLDKKPGTKPKIGFDGLESGSDGKIYVRPGGGMQKTTGGRQYYDQYQREADKVTQQRIDSAIALKEWEMDKEQEKQYNLKKAILAKPHDLALQLQKPEAKMTAKEKEIYQRHKEFQQVEPLMKNLEERAKDLQEAYRANNWHPDSQWAGVNDLLHLQELQQRLDSKRIYDQIHAKYVPLQEEQRAKGIQKMLSTPKNCIDGKSPYSSFNAKGLDKTQPLLLEKLDKNAKRPQSLAEKEQEELRANGGSSQGISTYDSFQGLAAIQRFKDANKPIFDPNRAGYQKALEKEDQSQDLYRVTDSPGEKPPAKEPDDSQLAKLLDQVNPKARPLPGPAGRLQKPLEELSPKELETFQMDHTQFVMNRLEHDLRGNVLNQAAQPFQDLQAAFQDFRDQMGCIDHAGNFLRNTTNQITSNFTTGQFDTLERVHNSMNQANQLYNNLMATQNLPGGHQQFVEQYQQRLQALRTHLEATQRELRSLGETQAAWSGTIRTIGVTVAALAAAGLAPATGGTSLGYLMAGGAGAIANLTLGVANDVTRAKPQGYSAQDVRNDLIQGGLTGISARLADQATSRLTSALISRAGAHLASRPLLAKAAGLGSKSLGDMAGGATGGFTDTAVQGLLGGKPINEALDDGFQAAWMGGLLAPVLGAGLRGAGKGIGLVKGKLFNKTAPDKIGGMPKGEPVLLGKSKPQPTHDLTGGNVKELFPSGKGGKLPPPKDPLAPSGNPGDKVPGGKNPKGTQAKDGKIPEGKAPQAKEGKGPDAKPPEAKGGKAPDNKASTAKSGESGGNGNSSKPNTPEAPHWEPNWNNFQNGELLPDSVQRFFQGRELITHEGHVIRVPQNARIRKSNNGAGIVIEDSSGNVLHRIMGVPETPGGPVMSGHYPYSEGYLRVTQNGKVIGLDGSPLHPLTQGPISNSDPIGHIPMQGGHPSIRRPTQQQVGAVNNSINRLQASLAEARSSVDTARAWLKGAQGADREAAQQLLREALERQRTIHSEIGRREAWVRYMEYLRRYLPY